MQAQAEEREASAYQSQGNRTSAPVRFLKRHTLAIAAVAVVFVVMAGVIVGAVGFASGVAPKVTITSIDAESVELTGDVPLGRSMTSIDAESVELTGDVPLERSITSIDAESVELTGDVPLGRSITSIDAESVELTGDVPLGRSITSIDAESVELTGDVPPNGVIAPIR